MFVNRISSLFYPPRIEAHMAFANAAEMRDNHNLIPLCVSWADISLHNESWVDEDELLETKEWAQNWKESNSDEVHNDCQPYTVS